jgi:hypothetical protein
MDLEDLLLERERTIDALRAEIGEAKAEEAKALHEAQEARGEVESQKAEVERVRKAGGRAEVELKRREGEVSLCLDDWGLIEWFWRMGDPGERTEVACGPKQMGVPGVWDGGRGNISVADEAWKWDGRVSDNL